MRLHLFRLRRTLIDIILTSNKKEQCWIWRNDGKEYYYDKHEWVRVRVEREEWNHVSPVSPSESQRALAGGRQCPYNIIASMEQSALGPVIWW